MKLNNRGFAITGIVYSLLVLFLIVIMLVLGILSNRKIMLNKVRDNTLDYVNDNITPTITEPVSFETDTWATISQAVKDENTLKYAVGDTKQVTLEGYGTFTVRISNMSTPNECLTEGFSQTACGFVVEFEDIITTHVMNTTNTIVGGYPASSMYTFLQNDIYNALPSDLKSVIINTLVVSSHGSIDASNYISTDKLYLLSNKEVWNGWINFDTSADKTRQLDYYTQAGVTESSYAGAIKKYNEEATMWWFRSISSYSDHMGNTVSIDGMSGDVDTTGIEGISPAFRIG